MAADPNPGTVRVLVTLEYPLSNDSAFLLDLYGTDDRAECVQIDFDGDPAAFLLDSTLVDLRLADD